MSEKHYFCNPLNVNYRYQFNKNPVSSSIDVNREAADPTLISFQGKYYLFSSMSLSVLVSEDLVNWESHRLPEELPLYGYAPDARVCGEYVIFCANESEEICHFYRTKDILRGPYEKIQGSFAFSDPCLFQDEDGKLYLYWGLSCKEPIYGVELEPETMRPMGERRGLIWGDPFRNGYERMGEDNAVLPCSEEELEVRYQAALQRSGAGDESHVPPQMAELMKDMLRDAPYIEGAWMNKFRGKYYLQYASPGTHFNVYGDGVYVSDSPLGPFVPARNNPYSYKPGGFFPGAGHGSTVEDEEGCLWHGATMRISVNHQFERRLGLWPAGIDEDGELFCNQRYGDWPGAMEDYRKNPWAEPKWYLLSYGKRATASSWTAGNGPERAVDENVRTWWQAAGEEPGEWLCVDLGQVCEVHGIQVNFGDSKADIRIAENYEDKIDIHNGRYIEEAGGYTRWVLEGSIGGRDFFLIEDKSRAETDLPHDLIVREEGVLIRFLRLKVLELPYGQKACVSGLRVFGRGQGEKPRLPVFQAVRTSELDMEVQLLEGTGEEQTGISGLERQSRSFARNSASTLAQVQGSAISPAQRLTDGGAEAERGASRTAQPLGYNILWGHAPDKLYHSCLTYELPRRIGALVKGQEYYVRVDAFNEAGITEGTVRKLEYKNENPDIKL